MSDGESKNEALLPGHDLITKGLCDLKENRTTEHALLVLVAGPRLRRLGIDVPHRTLSQPAEHELYERIEERLGNGAHSHYNSLLRRIDSYVHALEGERKRSAG